MPSLLLIIVKLYGERDGSKEETMTTEKKTFYLPHSCGFCGRGGNISKEALSLPLSSLCMNNRF
jgi:hypothetical protein